MTVLAGMALAGGLLVAPAEASSGTVVELRNAATGMCLAIGRGEARKGKTAIQWPCIHSPAQRWMSTPDGHLMNVATGMCLAIGGGQERRGKAAIQWTCNGGWEQRWKEKQIWRGSTDSQISGLPRHLMNGATAMCLAIGGGEARKGKTAIQWPCKKSLEQGWHVSVVG
ncbi:RICIN domain-containing protein [Nonomuraea sp. NPDC050691]|uniref:RICIN domain-containing protein n=1 Tax=Nonomuraea sp. NPDC050691 TaxID=3155661 RepID=UPI0033DAFCEA